MDEAIDEIADKAKSLIDEYGSDAVAFTCGTGRGSSHFMMRLQATMNATMVGPGNVCLAPFLMQTFITWGRQFHPYEAGDYRNAGCIVMWGANPIRSRRYTGKRILEGKRKGAKIIVVDPVFRDMSSRADLWVPVRPGTDGAIALCMTHLLFEDEYWKKDPSFLRNWTNGPFLVDDMGPSLLRGHQVAGGGEEGGGMQSCMMTTNAVQNGRAMSILQLLLEPPIDEPGGYFFNDFWEFMSSPVITRPDLLTKPPHSLGEERCPLFCKVGNAGSNPGEFWVAAARGDDNAPRMYISMASDPLGSQENTKNVWAGLNNPRTEMIVSMDYFMNPEGQIADIVPPGFSWDKANPNVLVDGLNGTDIGWGSAPMRGFLVKVCKIADAKIDGNAPVAL